jgi:hypothetical protein
MAQPAAGQPAPQQPRMGAYRPVDPASPEVQEARAAIQKQFTVLRIGSVTEAFVQVVAGLNYKLVCQVTEDDGASTWEFVIWHKLDRTWKLTAARQR